MVFKSLPFPEVGFLTSIAWSWLWHQHWHNCQISNSKTKTKPCLVAKILF